MTDPNQGLMVTRRVGLLALSAGLLHYRQTQPRKMIIEAIYP